jgi:hypothetical protein
MNAHDWLIVAAIIAFISCTIILNPPAWLRRKVTDRQRNIFKFYDGEKLRGVDPLLVWRLIMTHPDFNPEVHGPAFDKGDVEAWKIVLKCARDAFEIPPFTETGKPGLTEQELSSLFKRFLAYCDDLKKSFETSQPSLPSTEQTASTAYIPPPEVASIIAASAVSPSTSTDKPSEPVGCC